jgi:hypothetical protein
MMRDGNVMRDDSELHVRHDQSLSSCEPSTKEECAGSRPGILIFSRGRRLLHMNRRALELTGHINQDEIGLVHDLRSAPVRELSAQIQETLDHRRAVDIWEIFELKRVIFETERKILIRGFGLADRNSYDDSRIVIVLEEVARQQDYKTQSKPVFSSQSLCAVP